MTNSFDDFIGFSPVDPITNPDNTQITANEKSYDYNVTKLNSNHQSPRGRQEKSIGNEAILLGIAHSNINILFKDKHGEGFATIVVRDHEEPLSLKSARFKKYLSKLFFVETGSIANNETINCVVNLLQAEAEFGEEQHELTLRVAQLDGDFIYDLTNEKHQCVKISKEGYWQVLDKTPVPLFRRYNQSAQDIPISSASQHPLLQTQNADPLDYFLSNLTNVKDNETKLLIKVVLITWFIPDIPHIMLLVHGSEGSAKSTFMSLIKDIVDPSKPKLLTIHDNKSEFIQQLSHNYLTAYDNVKYNPKWLSDEVCKAVTGAGHTKRMLYTDDEDKIFEYKHCLMFNGINVAFSEPDALSRCILVELLQIDEEKRKTEKEILEIFNGIRPYVLGYIFDILAKAMTIKNKIKINRLPRMADSAVWGEAISISMGYKNGEFIRAYYNNIGFQNIEVVDSNPLAYAIKKFVEKRKAIIKSDNLVQDNTETFFEGSPATLLSQLNEIAQVEQVNTNQKDWPKDMRWLIRRIKTVQTSLQKSLGIRIEIDRDGKKNNSIVKIVQNNSTNSAKQMITPEVELLSPVFEKLTPDSCDLTPDKFTNPASESDNFGVTGVTGDKRDMFVSSNNVCNSDDEGAMSNEKSALTPFSNSDGLFYNYQNEQIPSGINDSQQKNTNVDEFYECYYCDNFPSNLSSNKVAYEKHITQTHPAALAYPSIADLNKKNIPPKGKKWE